MGHYSDVKELEAEASDMVRKPSHYAILGDVEAIQLIASSMTDEEWYGYCLGNIMKYRLRQGKKGDKIDAENDLKKALFYEELYEKHKGECRTHQSLRGVVRNK